MPIIPVWCWLRQEDLWVRQPSQTSVTAFSCRRLVSREWGKSRRKDTWPLPPNTAYVISGCVYLTCLPTLGERQTEGEEWWRKGKRRGQCFQANRQNYKASLSSRRRIGSSRRKKKRNLTDSMTEEWKSKVLEEDTDGMWTAEPKSKPRMTSVLGTQREVYDKVVTQHGLL